MPRSLSVLPYTPIWLRTGFLAALLWTYARVVLDTSFFVTTLHHRKEVDGKEHTRSKPTKNKHWSFSACGMYAAAIERKPRSIGYWIEKLFSNRNKMVLTIYDTVEGKAYDYINEHWRFEVAYFYWLDDNLILIHIDPDNYLRSIRLELNHEKRCATIIHTRYENSPRLYPGNNILSIELSQPEEMVYDLGFVTINGQEYIPLCSKSCDQILMLPRDPDSVANRRLSIYNLQPLQTAFTVGRFTGLSSIAGQPIVHGESLYFPILLKNEPRLWNCWNTQHKPIWTLDRFIEVNLAKLEDVAHMVININEVFENQDDTATRNITLNHSPLDAPWNFTKLGETVLKPCRDGKMLVHSIRYPEPECIYSPIETEKDDLPGSVYCFNVDM